MEPGSKADVPAEVKDTAKVELSDLEWQVLTALKREFEPDEPNPVEIKPNTVSITLGDELLLGEQSRHEARKRAAALVKLDRRRPPRRERPRGRRSGARRE